MDAAARYLKDLHATFGDWTLAIAGYNHGAGRVGAAIAKTGLRDAGALVRQRALSRYSSVVLATMLLIQRPGLLE